MTFSILGLGFVLGLKHALDTDHLIAVSTIVSGRKGILSSTGVGLLWGIGHTASLLLVGLAVIALRIQLSDKLALSMEFLVALMLTGLGANVLYKLTRGGKVHIHTHKHGNHIHAHPHVHEHVTRNQHLHHHMPFGLMPRRMKTHLSQGKKSLLIGMVHGLAGSAALMLIVLGTIASPGLALAYICVFGFGSLGGMMAMSALMGLPFVYLAHKSERLNTIVQGTSGFLSMGLGLFYAWQIVIVEKLLF